MWTALFIQYLIASHACHRFPLMHVLVIYEVHTSCFGWCCQSALSLSEVQVGLRPNICHRKASLEWNPPSNASYSQVAKWDVIVEPHGLVVLASILLLRISFEKHSSTRAAKICSSEIRKLSLNGFIPYILKFGMKPQWKHISKKKEKIESEVHLWGRKYDFCPDTQKCPDKNRRKWPDLAITELSANRCSQNFSSKPFQK